MGKRFDYPLPYEIYVNRQRQMRNYERTSMWLAAVFVVFALVWFGALVFGIAERLA